MVAIEIKDLVKIFKGKKGAKVDALKGVSLSVESGEVFGFLGPNGAGKSTTIKTIMGLIRPTSGKAFIMKNEAGSLAARRQVGYLPENPAFYEFLSADEYLDFVGKIFGMETGLLVRRQREVLELLELTEAHKRPIRSYSKGMVQRLGLAQVLLHDPEVYVLDEPMSGLDPIGRALVKNIILDLKSKGKSVFFSTHITADVESVCDRVGIIVKGELKSVRTVESIMSEGIVGYKVRVKDSRTGTLTEEDVEKSEISLFLDSVRQAGNEIMLVDLNRNNLEEYFLDIVKGR
jgi:ABC-2 type transport system ATP-binding protein